jgi:uncharacterized small protein (DUF1192 family)
MDEDDLLPRAKKPPKRDLAPLSVEELMLYIGELEGEIARVREEIKAKQKQRTGAEALFKR